MYDTRFLSIPVDTRIFFRHESVNGRLELDLDAEYQ
jgi:hypothetical protein